jgi:hypothetical protein
VGVQRRQGREGRGELCGLELLGVRATRDVDALAVNAIPAVCEAPSGIRTVVDLPHVTGNVRGLVAA